LAKGAINIGVNVLGAKEVAAAYGLFGKIRQREGCAGADPKSHGLKRNRFLVVAHCQLVHRSLSLSKPFPSISA
jgi:hypothetical protein